MRLSLETVPGFDSTPPAQRKTKRVLEVARAFILLAFAALETRSQVQKLYTQLQKTPSPRPPPQAPTQLPKHRAREPVAPTPQSGKNGAALFRRKHLKQGLAGAVGLARPERVERRAGGRIRPRQPSAPPRRIRRGSP